MPSFNLQSYGHIITHLSPGPHPKNISYFLAVFLLPTALLIPPSALSHRQLCFLFLPLIWIFQVRAFSQMGCVDVLGVDLALWSYCLLAFRDPRRTFKRVRVRSNSSIAESDETKKRQVWEEEYPSDLWSRIPWVLTLMVSFRYTNWKIGEPSHDRQQPCKGLTRQKYLKMVSISTLQHYLLLDVAAAYLQTDPYFFQPISIDTPFNLSTTETPAAFAPLKLLPPRLVRASIIAAQIYAAVNILFTLPALLAVALGVLPDEWSPHTWPMFFGPFSAVSTKGIRGLWGRWWHQTNRHITSTPGRGLNNLLGISSSSNMGFAALVTSAFFFSGLTHIGLIPPQPLATDVSVNEMRLHMGALFWVQILGFGIELVVIGLLGKNTSRLPSWAARFLTLSWTAAWLCMTLPLVTLPFRGMKYWEAYPVPFSPAQALLGKGWFTW
ncbi:hypothetical protein MMC07_008919 [Pseudocyphellaria aurata]|nr:hypothetical protein [Pseudocyphellaria aurata]